MLNGIIWTTQHTGKMRGIDSIGTSCANNPHCIKRRQNGESVCAHCYANTYMKMRKALRQHLEDNANIFTSRILSRNEIPVTNAFVYRFEAFGDLWNATQLCNYILICEVNTYTNFALWTKNVWILEEVFNEYNIAKPKNLSIVVSSPLLNKPMEIDRAKLWFVDHVFTVYDKKYAKENAVPINCGAKNCLGCQACYRKDTDFHISELLK